MIIRIRVLVVIGIMAALFAVPVSAKDDKSVRKDLTAVIALHGKSCGPVVSFKRQGENHYIADCQDKNSYRVFVDKKGRVVVDKKRKKRRRR